MLDAVDLHCDRDSQPGPVTGRHRGLRWAPLAASSVRPPSYLVTHSAASLARPIHRSIDRSVSPGRQIRADEYTHRLACN